MFCFICAKCFRSHSSFQYFTLEKVLPVRRKKKTFRLYHTEINPTNVQFVWAKIKFILLHRDVEEGSVLNIFVS